MYHRRETVQLNVDKKKNCLRYATMHVHHHHHRIGPHCLKSHEGFRVSSSANTIGLGQGVFLLVIPLLVEGGLLESRLLEGDSISECIGEFHL